RVISEWMWFYLTFKPGARLIFDQPDMPRQEPKAGDQTPSIKEAGPANQTGSPRLRLLKKTANDG
ncbi:MAG: hypothetical protein OEY86_16795, partial [Nitrospira sp.]|nr:hypothetical protein [Nitrospira sp.]